MEILSGLPHENAKYPSLVLVDGIVQMKIGFHSFNWRLKSGEQVRLRRHGVFRVESATKAIAFLRIEFLRKGWNPKGRRECLVAVPVRCEVTIRKGSIHLRRLSLYEWKNLLAVKERERDFDARWNRTPHPAVQMATVG